MLNELIIIVKYLMSITMVIVSIVAISTYFALKMKCNKIAKDFYAIRESGIVKETAKLFSNVVDDYGLYRDKQFFNIENVGNDSTSIFKEEIKIDFTIEDFFKEEK